MVMRLVREDGWASTEEIDVKKNELRKAVKEPEVEDGPVEDSPVEAEQEEESSISEAMNLSILEALLFATTHPLTAGRLAELLELESTKPIRSAIKLLNKQYEQAGRSFRIEQVAGGYQLLTLPEYG